jgi:hypothetical protein
MVPFFIPTMKTFSKSKSNDLTKTVLIFSIKRGNGGPGE